jgi:hypothetical protein
MVDSQAVSSHDGSVVAATCVEMSAASVAAERPSLAAVALTPTAVLDEARHAATQRRGISWQSMTMRDRS